LLLRFQPFGFLMETQNFLRRGFEGRNINVPGNAEGVPGAGEISLVSRSGFCLSVLSTSSQ
jgi:hypothetical protein